MFDASLTRKNPSLLCRDNRQFHGVITSIFLNQFHFLGIISTNFNEARRISIFSSKTFVIDFNHIFLDDPETDIEFYPAVYLIVLQR